MTIRIQLTLFVPPAQAVELEALRKLLDPMQASLIAAHVTLCREDEIEGIEPALIRQRMSASPVLPLTLTFGAPEPFSSHGILLPCLSGDEALQALRHNILGGSTVRRQSPHITLAHPRNPQAPGNSLANAAKLPSGLSITFKVISRIQQVDAQAWRTLDHFPLTSDRPPAVSPCA